METHVVSVMTNLHKETCAVVRDKKGRSFSPAPNSKANTDEGREKSSRTGREESSSDKRSKIPCRYKNSKNPSCKFWNPPVCLNYKFEKGCVHGDKCHFRHVEAEGKPNKKSKKGGAKRSVAILKESFPLGCVSQDSYPRKSIPREQGRILQWHLALNGEIIGPSRGLIRKCAPHERRLCAPKFGDRSREEHLAPRKMRPQSSVGFGETFLQAHEFGQSYVLCSW